MVKISANRLDMETKRIDRAQMKNYTETLVAVTSTATTTFNLLSGNVFDLTHNTDITSLVFSNVPASGQLCSVTIIRKKDFTANVRSIVWPASFKWVGGVAPTLTDTSLGLDIFTAFTKDGGTTWIAFVGGSNFS